MREPDISAGRGGLASVAAQYYQGASANIQAGMQNLQNAHDSIINRYKRQREQESHNKQMDYYDAQIRSTDAQTEHTQNRTRIDNEKLPHEISAMKAQEANYKANTKATNLQTAINYNDTKNFYGASEQQDALKRVGIAYGEWNNQNAAKNAANFIAYKQKSNTNQPTMANNQNAQPSNTNAQASNNLNDMQKYGQKLINFTKQNDNTNNNKVASAAVGPTLPMDNE